MAQHDVHIIPLLCAIYAGDVKGARKLIKAGATILEEYHIDGIRYTPLHIATERGVIDTCKDLVNAWASAFLIDADSISPLSLATKNTRNQNEILDYFFGLGTCISEVNKADEDGDRPLHYAACHGNKHAVEQLLKHGANPNVRNRVSTTPLWDACKVGNFDIVRLLTQYGAISSHEDTQDSCSVGDDCEAFPRSPLYDVLGLTPFLPEAQNIVYYLVDSGYDLSKEHWIPKGNFPTSLPHTGTSLTRWLVREARTPRSLQVLCRKTIKQTIGSYPKEVEELPLPRLIKDYILHRFISGQFRDRL
ncbi:poly [ADP-ribose] polymerase tankyrase-2-like [Lineus longissimus]|uniref:poly [ADP-ribose] polymerase tankyrase-2-like n=1 Tax=Lineus longissimus TaxID=88925 RepID=UPI002B4D4E1C